MVPTIYFNVKQYGAKGDGSTDDTAAINATLAALPSAGGTIFFPPGTYLISSTLVVSSDNVQLIGAGWNAIVTPKNTFTGAPLIKVAAPGGAGNFRYGIKIADLYLNGNNNTGMGGIELDSTYMAVIDHVRIRYCPGTGIYLTDPSSGTARGAYTTIRHCDITDGGAGTAILSAYAENYTVDGGLIAFYNTSGGVGIKCQDGGCTITNVQYDMCDTSVWMSFANSNQILDCNFGRAVSRHVYLNGAKYTVVANNYFDQCTGTPSPAAIIYADNSANASNVIANNTCIGASGWAYFYYEAGGIGVPGNIVGNNQTNGLAQQSFRSIPTKPWYDVSQFGAKGDGTTDDTAAIQSAITAATNIASGAAFSQNGAGVYFPPTAASYLISAPLVINWPISLIGGGWGSVIQLKNASNCDMIQFNPQTSDWFNGASIRDIKLDGNGNNQTTAGYIVNAKGAVWCHFDHVWFRTPWEAGLSLHDDGLGGFGHHNTVDHCFFDSGKNSNGGNGRGLYITHSDENMITNNTFQDCGRLASGEPCAIWEDSGLNSFVNNQFVTGAGGFKSYGNRNIFLGNRFDGCGNHNMNIKGTGNLIKDNWFYNLGVSGSNVDGIALDNAPENQVMGNGFVVFNGTNFSRYFINLNPFGTASTSTHIEGNYMTNTGGGTLGSGQINISTGTGHIIRNNHGYNPVGQVTAPAFPATTVAATNTTGSDVTAFIANGTGAITQVQIAGVAGTYVNTNFQIAASGWGAIRIPTGGSVKFTYASGSPAWTWFGD